MKEFCYVVIPTPNCCLKCSYQSENAGTHAKLHFMSNFVRLIDVELLSCRQFSAQLAFLLFSHMYYFASSLSSVTQSFDLLVALSPFLFPFSPEPASFFISCTHSPPPFSRRVQTAQPVFPPLYAKSFQF